MFTFFESLYHIKYIDLKLTIGFLITLLVALRSYCKGMLGSPNRLLNALLAKWRSYTVFMHGAIQWQASTALFLRCRGRCPLLPLAFSIPRAMAPLRFPDKRLVAFGYPMFATDMSVPFPVLLTDLTIWQEVQIIQYPLCMCPQFILYWYLCS